MKQTLTFLATFIIVSIFSQVPEKISYQAVIRNASNTLVANQSVGIKISILQGTATGSSVYTETHTITTNANGLASLQIGGGTVISGAFSSIDWANGPFFIKTETDPLGGTNYTLTGTSQLLSVPYALYAKTAGSSTPGPQGANGKNTLVNTTTEPAGSNCANGGTKIEFGLDANSNGILESSEINNALTKYVCNGNGSSTNITGSGNHGSVILGSGQIQNWTVPEGVTLLNITLFSSIGGDSGQTCKSGNCAWPCSSGKGGNYIGASFIFNSIPGQIFGLQVGVNGVRGNNSNSLCSPGSPGTDGTDSFITINGIELIRATGGKGGTGNADSCDTAPNCSKGNGSNGSLIFNPGNGILQLQSTIGGTLYGTSGPNLIKIEY